MAYNVVYVKKFQRGFFEKVEMKTVTLSSFLSFFQLQRGNKCTKVGSSFAKYSYINFGFYSFAAHAQFPTSNFLGNKKSIYASSKRYLYVTLYVMLVGTILHQKTLFISVDCHLVEYLLHTHYRHTSSLQPMLLKSIIAQPEKPKLNICLHRLPSLYMSKALPSDLFNVQQRM